MERIELAEPVGAGRVKGYKGEDCADCRTDPSFKEKRLPLIDLFSYRKRVADGTIPDVYVYGLPDEVRVQIAHIWQDAIGSWEENYDTWVDFHDIVAREHGVFKLSHGRYRANLLSARRAK